jgi:hypothetical protein
VRRVYWFERISQDLPTERASAPVVQPHTAYVQLHMPLIESFLFPPLLLLRPGWRRMRGLSRTLMRMSCCWHAWMRGCTPCSRWVGRCAYWAARWTLLVGVMVLATSDLCILPDDVS